MLRILPLLFVAFSASPALACSCARGGPMPPVVVRAKVLDVLPANGQVMARVRVLAVERGRAEAAATVWTPRSSAACGVVFRRGAVMRLGMAPATDGLQTRGRGNYTANSCQQFRLTQ